MRKKFTMLLASLFLVMGTSVAQVYQKVPHTKWTVTALNEAGVSGNEGGVAFIKDENPQTFYHSNWGAGYEGGTSGKNKGQDGVQAFLVEMGEVYTLDRITYTGRSNGPNNWATKVRIYIYESLPEGCPANLSTLTYQAKEELLSKDNTNLGTPAFSNADSPWANDQSMKTVDFDTPKTGKYILFVADATTGDNGYFTCSDFHVWQKVEGVVSDKPYYLKISDLENSYLDIKDGVSSDYGRNTVSKSETPVVAYLALNNGYWHISSLPGDERNFVGVGDWDATPGQPEPTNWTLHSNGANSWSLAQSMYYGDNNASKHYLGANGGDISGQTKLYTDKTIGRAVKFQLVELTEEQATAEATRVVAENLAYAKETATAWLNRTGAGYPAADSEARTTLQNAINAADATKETIDAALAAYQAHQTVVMPEVGKVYRLVSGYTEFASKKALYSDNNELKWQNKNDAAMNQLWTVQSMSSGNIVLMNVNDALYPQKTGFTAKVTMFSEKNECKILFCGKGQFQVFANKEQRMFANGYNNGSGESGNITNYNDGGADSYSSWYFEEVSITKDILSKQIESLKAAYIGSLLVKQESVADLQTAVNAAQEVCNAEGDYATALASLVNTLNATTIDYIEQGYFRMKSKEGVKYAYNDNTSLKATTDKNSPKTIIKLTEANNGTFYIQNGNGYYAQGVSQSTMVNTAATPIEYVITRLASDHYVLRPKNSTTVRGFWHQDGSSKVVGWSSDAGNSQWTFEALTVEEAEKIYAVRDLNASADVYVTYNGEGYTGDKDVKQAGGFYVLDNAPTTADFTVANVGEGMISSVVVDGKSLSVNAGYDGKNIYTLRCMKGDSYARYNSGCQLSDVDATNMLTYEGQTHYESLFFIEKGTGDYADYYTIRSVAAPTMYAYNLETADKDSKVAMKEAPTEGGLTDAYYWKISSFGKDAGNITPKGGDAFGWNKRGSYDGKDHIGFWQNGNGYEDNKWFVRLVEEEFVPSQHSVIGYPTKESREEYLSYAEIITQTGFNKLKNAKYDIVLPEAGKFYRFSHDYGTGGVKYVQAIASNAPNKKNALLMSEEQDIASIFYYGDDKLRSYSTGLYVNDKGGNRGLQAEGGAAKFEKGTTLGKLGIFAGDSFHANQDGDIYFIDHCGSVHSSAHDFTVEEVDMTPIVSELEALAAKATTIAGYTFIAAETKTQLTTAATNATSAANALKSGAFAKDMTAEIAALIESAVYVTTADGFSNKAVYTFLSNRNAEAYMMYDGTNDFVASKYMQTSLAVGSDVENCQWAVYKSGEGNYYMYNLGAQKFMGTESEADTSIPFSEKPQTTALKFQISSVATHPIMISSNGGAGAVNHSNNSHSGKNVAGIINWKDGFSYTEDPGNVHKVAIVGELDEATLGTIKGLVDAFEKGDILEEFNELAYSARGYVSWMVWGRYDHELYDNPEAVAGEIERIDLSIGDGEDATIAEIQAAIQEIEAIIAGFNIEEITPGFYYFVNYEYNDAGEYLSDDISNNGTQRVLTTEVSAKNIFYYDGQKLIAYASGFGFEYGICNTGTPDKMNHFVFGMAYEPGKYTVKSSEGTSLVGWADGYWQNKNGELARVSAAEASGWDIQAVASLPVTIGSVRHATFYAPVAVNIPAEVTASIISEINGDEVVLQQVTGVVPAGTGLILEAEQGTYNFDIATEEAPANFEKGYLKGTIAKSIITAEDNTNYYVLANTNGKVGLYKAKVNRDANGEKVDEGGVAFLNNANRVYLPVVTSQGAMAPAMFRFRGKEQGTTEIEVPATNDQQPAVIYDLTGRRIEKIVEKGIYIVNGKKVVIK